jgi:hypothetical protein
LQPRFSDPPGAAPGLQLAGFSSYLPPSRFRSDPKTQILDLHLPASNSNSVLIRSIFKLGPGPNCAIVEFCREGCGVPERAGRAGMDPRPLTQGGVDLGRVLISRGGSAFPLAEGNISSRLTGIPNAMRCCRRIRDCVQLGSFMGGGVCNSTLYISRLLLCSIQSQNQETCLLTFLALLIFVQLPPPHEWDHLL